MSGYPDFNQGIIAEELARSQLHTKMSIPATNTAP